MNIEQIVKIPYTTRPYMVRNIGDVFNNNPDNFYRQQKEQQLKLFDSDLYGYTDSARSMNLVRRAATYLGKPPTDSIVDFALNFEEDIAILHNGILSSICFCFPSSWIPKTRIGLKLNEIHEPVADGDSLRQVGDKLAKTMADPLMGSFKRYVWTVTTVPSLSNHPNINQHYQEDGIDFNTLYFRTETQTTLALPDGMTSLFFVRVAVCPLKEVWLDHSSLILDGINSMTDNVLRYKNLNEIKNYLNKNMRV